MNIVKVLIFAPSPPPYAGPEVATAELLKYLNYEDLIIKHLKSNIRKENWQKGKFDIAGLLKFFCLYMKFLYNLCSFNPAKVYLLLSSSRIGFLRDSAIIIAAKLFNKIVIAHYRGGNFNNFYSKQSFRYKKFIKWSLGKIDCIIVQAHILKPIFKGLFDINKILVLYNGVKIADYQPKKSFGNRLNLLFLGHIAYSKGFYHLICAYKKLFSEYNLRLSFAGTLRFDYSKSETQKEFLFGDNLNFYNSNQVLINQTISDFVRNAADYNAVYLGIIDGEEKEKAFGNSDCFILPSLTEGFSLSVLEAMQRGLPVITSRVGAFPEIIEEGVNGFFVNNVDSNEISKTIIKAANDKDLLVNISSNNIQYVKNKYNINIIANDLRNILLNC